MKKLKTTNKKSEKQKWRNWKTKNEEIENKYDEVTSSFVFFNFFRFNFWFFSVFLCEVFVKKLGFVIVLCSVTSKRHHFVVSQIQTYKLVQICCADFIAAMYQYQTEDLWIVFGLRPIITCSALVKQLFRIKFCIIHELFLKPFDHVQFWGKIFSPTCVETIQWQNYTSKIRIKILASSE